MGGRGCGSTPVDPQIRRRQGLRLRRCRGGPEIGDRARPGGPARGARHLGPVWARGPRAQQFLVELGGFWLGRCAELPLQCVYALLVLAQRSLPAPEPPVQPHDRAVDGLLQGVQREETEARRRRALCGAPDSQARHRCLFTLPGKPILIALYAL